MKRTRQVGKRLKNHFIPNSENNYKPYILRRKMIAFVCLIVIVGECAFIFGSQYLIPRSTLYGLIEVNALVDETNQNRATNGLPTLSVDPLLQAAAQEKANDMATKNYFAHTSPQGLTPWYWFENVGYQFDYAGENLAVNFTDSEDVTNAWMNSPEHRANILSGDFTQIGIATAQGIYNGQPATYVVEEFGTPAPTSTPVAFVNTAAAQSVPTTAPMPPVATTPTTTSNSKATVTVPASTPKRTPTITKVSSTSVPVVPTIVTMQSSSDSSSAQTFIAVANPAVVTTTGAITPAASAIGLNQPTQSNWVQKLFSDPRSVANDFYLLIIAIFGLASMLNFFIKIRIQYPRIIASGIVVIVLSGLCITLNQHIGLLHAAIL